MTSVAIVDRQAGQRFLMCKILTECEKFQFKVVSEATSIEKLGQHIKEVQPDIVLMEFEEQTFGEMMHFHTVCPKTELIVYSNSYNYNTVRKAFEAGAVSFLLKENYINELIDSVNYTLQGGSFISPAITRGLVMHSVVRSTEVDSLSERERLVIDEILEGLSYKLIGYKHNLSLDTVRQYIKRAYRKLHINSKGELMAKMR